MSPLLECSLTVGYDGFAVARDIPLRLEPAEIVAVLGPNGAGKTTFLLTLAGFLAPIAGEFTLDDVAVKTGSARRMNRAGVVLVPDHRALFTQLTTLENLGVASRKSGRTVDEVLDLFPVLRGRAKLRAGELSGGEQQMLAMARALVQRPRVLLVDEMSMGLAPIIVESMMPTLRHVATETSAAIVLVEQHVRLALEVADQAVVLVHGEVRLAGASAPLLADAALLESAYLSDTSGSSKSEGLSDSSMEVT